MTDDQVPLYSGKTILHIESEYICPECLENVSVKWNYCPHCGNELKFYGLQQTNDSEE